MVSARSITGRFWPAVPATDLAETGFCSAQRPCQTVSGAPGAIIPIWNEHQEAASRLPS